MNGTPPNGVVRTGEWAEHTQDDDTRHCVCWRDGVGPCCRCGEAAAS